MQSPLTVAFEIHRPWPRRSGKFRYWPPLITVWHRDPSGFDDKTCHTYPGKAWRLHVHHWRLQIHPYQQARRRLLTRCSICGGRSKPGHVVNLQQGNREPSPWWRGEKGLCHMDCAGLRIAEEEQR